MGIENSIQWLKNELAFNINPKLVRIEEKLNKLLPKEELENTKLKDARAEALREH